jgi:hypothetical protein
MNIEDAGYGQQQDRAQVSLQHLDVEVVSGFKQQSG